MAVRVCCNQKAQGLLELRGEIEHHQAEVLKICPLILNMELALKLELSYTGIVSGQDTPNNKNKWFDGCMSRS